MCTKNSPHLFLLQEDNSGLNQTHGEREDQTNSPKYPPLYVVVDQLHLDQRQPENERDSVDPIPQIVKSPSANRSPQKDTKSPLKKLKLSTAPNKSAENSNKVTEEIKGNKSSGSKQDSKASGVSGSVKPESAQRMKFLDDPNIKKEINSSPLQGVKSASTLPARWFEEK